MLRSRRFDEKDAEIRAKDTEITRWKRMNELAGVGLDTDNAEHRGIGNENRSAAEEIEKDDSVHNVPKEYRLLQAVNQIFLRPAGRWSRR